MKLHSSHGMWFHSYCGPEDEELSGALNRAADVQLLVFVNYCNVHLIKEGKEGEKLYCLVVWNQVRGNNNCLYNHPKGMTGKYDVYQWWSDWPHAFRKTMSAPGWTQKLFDQGNTEKESWGFSLHAHIHGSIGRPALTYWWNFGVRIQNGYWHLPGIGLWRALGRLEVSEWQRCRRIPAASRGERVSNSQIFKGCFLFSVDEDRSGK